MVSSSPGRKVAVDASMSLYQFLIAVRADGSQLTSSDGETTRWEVVGVRMYTYILHHSILADIHSYETSTRVRGLGLRLGRWAYIRVIP